MTKNKAETDGLHFPSIEAPLGSSRSLRSLSEDDKRYEAKHQLYGTITAPKADKTREKRRTHKASKVSSSSSVSLHTSSPSSERNTLLSASKLKALWARSDETKLPDLQTVKKHHALVGNYRTYRLANFSSRYNDVVSSSVAKIMKKVKSQIKAHFFDPKDPISIVGFLATFKLPCDMDKIHEGATMRILSNFVKKPIGNAQNSRMCTESQSGPLAATACNNDV